MTDVDPSIQFYKDQNAAHVKTARKVGRSSKRRKLRIPEVETKSTVVNSLYNTCLWHDSGISGKGIYHYSQFRGAQQVIPVISLDIVMKLRIELGHLNFTLFSAHFIILIQKQLYE